MKRLFKAGFTIIETMLFLGITGLLVIGVMVGFGSSINIQRYRDSVASLQSILQQQFSEVNNVANNNSTNLCTDGSNVTGTYQRGQSSCIVLGRYITTADGVNFTTKSVLGNEPVSIGSTTDDLSIFKLYNIYTSAAASDTYEMNWGTKLVKPTTSNPAAFSMLVLRSPVSGTIRTYIDSAASIPISPVNGIRSLLTSAAQIQTVKLCVDSNGLLPSSGSTATNKSAVLINPSASTASAIEKLGEATSGC